MAWLRARSIGSRLLRMLITPVVGVLAVAWLVWEVSIAPALRDTVGQHQLEVARRAADLIDEFMDRRVDELRRTVQIGRLWEESPEEQKSRLDRMLQLSPLIEEVAIADARGAEQLRFSRSRSFLPSDLRDVGGTDTFRLASERKVSISDVYARGAAPMVTLAVGMPSNAPAVKGVLTAEVSLKTLWDAVAHIRVGTAGHPFVVDRKGTFVAHPDPSKMGMRARDSYHPSVWALIENRAAGMTELAYAEAAGLVVSWVLIPQTGMTVVVAEPKRTALATLHHIERLGLAILALSVTGVVLTTTWFSRRLSRTLAELAAGADLIARGNLDHSLRITSGDELESLAGQFNGMASQLRASYAALESEVMVKTLDLQALYAVTTPSSRTGDVKGVLEEAVAKLIDVTGADAAAIELLSEPPVLVQHGFSGVWPLPPFIPADVEIHAELARAGARHRRFLDEGFTSAAFVPLLINGAPGGVVTLAARTNDQLPPRARELFRAIGHQIAVAVENARLYAETQRAMRELRDKNAELDTFVYSVSHDLKAPVVTIQGMAGLLLDGAANQLAEKDRHYLTRIDASCSHMQALILQLLALSQVGRDAWTSENVHLNDLVDAVLDDLQAAVSARGVRVTVDDLPVVRAPRVHMHEIFVNLLSNAIKYFGPVAEPSISVGAKHHGDHVELWVSDNGVGIDPAYHGKVFEAFQRLKDVSAEGSGVGLAIVKKIIETAGGRIWVESARGEGATFRFTWPGGGAASPPSATA